MYPWVGFTAILKYRKPSPNCANPNKAPNDVVRFQKSRWNPPKPTEVSPHLNSNSPARKREKLEQLRAVFSLSPHSHPIRSRVFSWLTAFPFHLTRINYHSWPFRLRLRILPANGNLGRMFAPKMVPLLSLEYDYARSFVYIFSFSHLLFLMHSMLLFTEWSDARAIMMSWFFFLFFLFGWKCAVVACQAVANIVKSSLGPVGLDKVRFACIYSLWTGLILEWNWTCLFDEMKTGVLIWRLLGLDLDLYSLKTGFW